MINLLSSESKREIRAARMNVILRRYVTFMIIVTVTIFGAFAFGLYLTTQERARLEAEINSSEIGSDRYKSIQKAAEQFSENLKTAKTIISKEVVFSQMILDITKSIPGNVLLTELNVTTEMLGNPVTISARGKDSDVSPLNLKRSLEDSALFKDVIILSISRPEKLDGLEGVEREYPVTYDLKATIDKDAGKRNLQGVQL